MPLPTAGAVNAKMAGTAGADREGLGGTVAAERDAVGAPVGAPVGPDGAHAASSNPNAATRRRRVSGKVLPEVLDGAGPG